MLGMLFDVMKMFIMFRLLMLVNVVVFCDNVELYV